MYSNSKQVRSVADAVSKILNPQNEQVQSLEEGMPPEKGARFKITTMKDNDPVKSRIEFSGDTKGSSLGDAKQSLKDKIKPEHHSKYGIDSTESFSHAGEKYHKAKMAGHLKEEFMEEGWDDMIADVKKRNGPQPSGGSGIKQGSRYGGSKQKDEPEAEEKPKAKKKKPFSEMVSTYKETGLKSLQEWAKKKAMKEEASNEEFTKEVKEAQAKSEGKGKKAEVAKAAVQAVKNEEVELNLEDYSLEELEEFMFSEEYAQLDELSKDTYKSYVDKSRGEVKKALGRRQSGGNEVGPKTFIPSTSRYAEPNTARRGANTNKGIVHAIKKMREETEQLDELSKTTLGNYVNAAKDDNKAHADSRRSGDAEESRWAKDRMVKRSTGMGAAKQRLNKEEAETVEEELKGNQHKIDKNKNNKIDAHDFKLLRKEDTHTTVEVFDFNDVNGVKTSTIELDERSLTASEDAKKEEIVKSMKKNISGFKARYGKDAKSVMYATATKNAKND